MTDFEKLNSKTCANAAYNLLYIAKRAIWDAEGFVNGDWMEKQMGNMITTINRIADVLWDMM